MNADISTCKKFFHFAVISLLLLIITIYYNIDKGVKEVHPYGNTNYDVTVVVKGDKGVEGESKVKSSHVDVHNNSSKNKLYDLPKATTKRGLQTTTSPTTTTSIITITKTTTTTPPPIPKYSKKKLIHIYTNFFGSNPWPYYHVNINYTKKCGCDFLRCELTYDRNRFRESDAVLFHGRDMPSFPELENLMKLRKLGQKWVYFILENPFNAADVKPLEKYFNWSITYRLSSDVQMPYRRHKKLEKELHPDDTNYAIGKTKQVAWLVGHCGTLRDQLARRLEQDGINVDVGGGCASHFPHRLQCRNKDCINELKKYKFYFAAENNLCKDYITEKYWHQGFRANAIPIVLGGSNYSNPKLAIPGSFIDAMSFKTPKHLADHLKELDKDNKKFNEYFKWRSKWKLLPFIDNGCEESLCNLCTKLHQNNRSTDRPLGSYIDKWKECGPSERQFRSWVNT